MLYIKQQGFSLSELMIAMVLGLFITGAALTLFVSIFHSNTENLARQHLSQDMRAALTMMSHDIERASYWGNAVQTMFPQANLTLSQTTEGVAIALDADSSNVFDTTGMDLVGMTLVGLNGQATITAVSDSNTLSLNITKAFDGNSLQSGTWGLLNPFELLYPTDNTPQNCILLTYDMDGDNVVDNEERIGYRLNGSTVQVFQTGNFACNDGTWEDLTDATTNVTNLEFVLDSDSYDIDSTGPGTSLVVSRQINLNFTAELTANAQINRDYSSQFKVHNDLFVP